jgi:hypothetical protein
MPTGQFPSADTGGVISVILIKDRPFYSSHNRMKIASMKSRISPGIFVHSDDLRPGELKTIVPIGSDKKQAAEQQHRGRPSENVGIVEKNSHNSAPEACLPCRSMITARLIRTDVHATHHGYELQFLYKPKTQTR